MKRSSKPEQNILKFQRHLLNSSPDKHPDKKYLKSLIIELTSLFDIGILWRYNRVSQFSLSIGALVGVGGEWRDWCYARFCKTSWRNKGGEQMLQPKSRWTQPPVETMFVSHWSRSAERLPRMACSVAILAVTNEHPTA